MPDIKETIANVRKDQQDRKGPPKFVSGDVVPGEVKETQDIPEDPPEVSKDE